MGVCKDAAALPSRRASRNFCALHIETIAWKFTTRASLRHRFAKDGASRRVDSPAVASGMAVADRAAEHRQPGV
eukprot:scaffold65064_cov68-Phaeocystis_antarctica.AAC.7